jgi:subtilisin-like proprotein convertase family protein
MTSAGPPEHRRPSLIDINLIPIKEWKPPISLFGVIVAILILVFIYAVFPFATLAEDYDWPDIPNLYGLWHEQKDDINSLEDTLAEREAYRTWLIGQVEQAGDLNEQIDAAENLLGTMEQDYAALSQGTITWSSVLETIEDAAPAGVNLISIAQGSSIEIAGTATSDALISEYAAALEDTGLFASVDITEHEFKETTSSSSNIVIETCDNVWNTHSGAVFTWADPKDYVAGLYSAKQSITKAFGNGLVAYQNVATDLRDAKYVVFWIKSSTDQPEGVLQLVFYSPAFEPYAPITLVKQYTNNTDVGITDPPPADQWANSDITIPPADDLIITSVDVYVKITHAARGELIVKVKHPDGTEDVLHNLVDGGADIDQWYLNRTIFNGKRSQGTWKLLVLDTVTGNTGYIDTWMLKITGTIPLTPAPTPTPTPAPTPTPTPTPVAWPTIEYSPPSLCFSAREGTNPSGQILKIWNSTGGTLNWSATSNATWLTLDLTSGSSTGETDYVTVSVNVTGMSAGSYTGTITIKERTYPEAVSPQTVTVYLNIREPIVVERLDVPALTADTWIEVIMPLSNASDIWPDYSVALYATGDPDACVVWLDDIRAALEPTPGPYSFVITVTLAGGGE